MKLFALLLCVGLAAAAPSWQWQSGKEHVFQYNGRILTGLPEMSSQYSGLGIKCDVVLQAKSDRELRMTLRHVKFTRVNDKLSASSPTASEQSYAQYGSGSHAGGPENNWRNLELPTFSPVSPDMVTVLSTPVVFTLRDGEIKTVTVSGSEPEWALNFKKALVVLFQTKFERSTLDLELNTINKESYETKNYWKVAEETIDGVCDTIYQVNELPEYFVKERSDMFPRMESCPNKKYIEVVKTKDLSTCVKSSIYRFVKPGMGASACTTPQCIANIFGGSSSVTRYYACGSRSNPVLQSIVNEGELSQKIFGENTENIVTGTRQVLLLKKIETITHTLPEPSQPRVIESVSYEYYPRSGQSLLRSQVGLIPKIPQSELKNAYVYRYLPRHYLPTPSSQETQQRLSPEKVMTEVKEIVEKIMHDLTQVEDIAEKEIPMKIMSVVRAFTFLKEEEMKTVYTELKKRFSTSEEKLRMFQNIYFDSIVLAGTTPAVTFLKEMIKSQEMPKVQAISVISLLPHHIITPSTEVFESLFELVQTESVNKNRVLYNTAVLSLTNLVQKVCLDEARNINYPSSIFGEFCNPQSEIVVEKLIPYLTRELKHTTNVDKRNMLVVALGTLSHKDIVPILLPLVEGSIALRPEYAPRSEYSYRNVTRFLSVYALGNAGARHPELVLPVVFSIFNNPAENTEIRIAAFTTMIKLNPPMVYMQKIASSTWSEKDVEVLNTVYSTIYSLAQKQEIVTLERTSAVYPSLIKKSQIILPLLRKITGSLPSSGSIYSSEYMPAAKTGYKSLVSWINNYNSFIPSDVYYKIEYMLGQYHFSPLEVAFKMHGVENIYQKFSQLMAPLTPEEEREQELSGEYRSHEHLHGRHHGHRRGGRYTTESRRLSEEEYHRSQQTGEERMQKMRFLEEQYEKTLRQIKGQLHKEWTKVIDQLKIKTRENGPLSSLAYLNLFDDVKYFVSVSDVTNQLIHEKITPLLKNPAHIMSKVCGSTPISFQRMMNIAPSEVLIPSEMGFPIIIETHMPTTISVRGKMHVKCETRVPSITMDTKVSAFNTIHGRVGTYCPFTKDMVATGISHDVLLNIPAKTHIAFEPESSQLKVKITPISSSSKPVDILSSKIRPYTVHHSYYSFLPKITSANMKVIHTIQPLKKMEIPFGSSLGLNFKSVVETETRYLDLTYVYQTLKSYNFNPINMIRFIALPSVSESGRFTFRRHTYKLQYDPITSQTKEIEMSFKVGCMTKKTGEEPLYHNVDIKSLEQLQGETTILRKLNPYTILSRPISEQVHPVRQEVLKKIAEKLQLKSGMGFIFQFTTVLKGSRPSTYTYEMSAGIGNDVSMKQKWHLTLESQPRSPAMNGKICVNGYANIPTIPSWDIDMIRNTDMNFEYKNTIGFGKTCEESKIRVIGTSKVSEKQKRMSRESPIARECQRLVELQIPGAHSSRPCEETRILAKTIDEVDFKVEYINTPPYVRFIDEKITEGLKALLWPYLRQQTSHTATPIVEHFGENRQVNVRFVFDKTVNVFDLYINKPEETVEFKNVRIPYPISVFLPLTLGRESNVLRGLETVTGRSLYPTCEVEKSWLRTFDNRSIPAELDNCFHLLSGDCSSTFRFGVLTRTVHPHSLTKEVKIFLNRTEVVFTPSTSFSRYSRDIRVTVNGTEITIHKNSKKTIREEETAEFVCEISRSVDGVLHFKAPEYYLFVKFDGERISVQSSQMLKNKLCGLCGDFNHQRMSDLRGPRKCIYSRPEVEIAAYRISSPQCKALETSVKESLITESRQCAKYTELPTEVYKSFVSMAGQCSRQQHKILERGNELCFSRIPVLQCGAQCSPKPRQLSTMKVKFTCLKKGRLAELYREKTIQGLTLPELKNKEESFVTEILVPQSCKSTVYGFPTVNGLNGSIISSNGNTLNGVTGSGIHSEPMINGAAPHHYAGSATGATDRTASNKQRLN